MNRGERKSEGSEIREHARDSLAASDGTLCNISIQLTIDNATVSKVFNQRLAQVEARLGRVVWHQQIKTCERVTTGRRLSNEVSKDEAGAIVVKIRDGVLVGLILVVDFN
jgi:hypothetical protein